RTSTTSVSLYHMRLIYTPTLTNQQSHPPIIFFFFFNDTATTEIYTLSLHDALPIYRSAHKFEQICRHRLRRQNVGYSNFSQPQSHLSFCVLLQYLVERRRVVTQLGKLD